MHTPMQHPFVPIWTILVWITLIFAMLWSFSFYARILVTFAVGLFSLVTLGISNILLTTRSEPVNLPGIFGTMVILLIFLSSAALAEIYGHARYYRLYLVLVIALIITGVVRTVLIRRWEMLGLQFIFVVSLCVLPFIVVANIPRHLHRTVVLGDTIHARLLLMLGADPNTPAYNDSFLNIALDHVKRPYAVPEMIQLLLVYGADPNTSFNSLGMSALKEAVFRGEFAIANDLLDAGASPVHNNDSGADILIWATLHGNSDFLSTLLQFEDVHINARDPASGASALYFATSPEIAEFLMSNGADTGQLTDRGETLLHWHSRRANPDMVRYWMTREFSPHTADADGSIPFVSAFLPLVEQLSSCNNADRIAVIQILGETIAKTHPARQRARELAMESECTNLLVWIE
jgi:hypothetical protein